MQRIRQRYYDVDIIDDQRNEISPIIYEVYTLIREYAESEDLMADFHIDFRQGSSFYLDRNRYSLVVTLTDAQIVDDVIGAVAKFLHDIYDEMDPEFTDDLYEFQIGIGTGTPRSRPASLVGKEASESTSEFTGDMYELQVGVDTDTPQSRPALLVDKEASESTSEFTGDMYEPK